MRSVAITEYIWGREMTLERLEERVVLDGSLDHHMSYAYALDPGAEACDHHTSHMYAPDTGMMAGDHHVSYAEALDPGALVRDDVFDGAVHALDAYAYVWFDGIYLWYWTNNNWDAAYNVWGNWFFVYTGHTNLPGFSDNDWHYCDWGMYWDDHGQYVLGHYVVHPEVPGDTDWVFEFYNVTTNSAWFDWACYNLGPDGIVNPTDWELLLVSHDTDNNLEYTDPDSLVIPIYDLQFSNPGQCVDAIGTLASLFGIQWDVVALDDHGNGQDSFLFANQWITPSNCMSFQSDFEELGTYMDHTANSMTWWGMVQLYACGPAHNGGLMLSNIYGMLTAYGGCYLFASDNSTGGSGDFLLEWPGWYAPLIGNPGPGPLYGPMPQSWCVYSG